LIKQLFSAIRVKNNYEIKRILDSGISKDIKGEHGASLLLIAVLDSNTDLVKSLVERVPTSIVLRGFRLSPLLGAIIRHDWNTAEMLIKAGADPNQPDFNLSTPLILTQWVSAVRR